LRFETALRVPGGSIPVRLKGFMGATGVVPQHPPPPAGLRRCPPLVAAGMAHRGFRPGNERRESRVLPNDRAQRRKAVCECCVQGGTVAQHYVDWNAQLYALIAVAQAPLRSSQTRTCGYSSRWPSE
jgi:hypothetical protein